MPTFITRLDLVTGQSLKFGEEWPGEELRDENGQRTGGGFKIAIIIGRLEVEATILVEAEEEGEQEEAAVEKTPAVYEVWLLPEDLFKEIWTFFGGVYAGAQVTPDALMRARDAVKNVPCRSVQAKHVVFSEEVWSMAEAYPLLQQFFIETFKKATAGDEEPAPAATARPRLQAPLNGPQQQGG